jgi:hypothetical protein
MRNFPVRHAYRAVGKKAFVAPIDPGAPTWIRYGESKREQKRHAQKMEKSRGFDLGSVP